MAELTHVISLGAGVQSSTMALMAAHDEIQPMPACAIFADTQAEPQSVYDWLNWLEKQLPFPVYRVTAGNLADDGRELRVSKKSGKRYTRTLIPLFTRSEQIKPATMFEAEGVMIKKGIFPRKCTRDYKIVVIRRFEREHFGINPREKEVRIRQWIGISADETIRMKDSDKPWTENYYPLVELGMTRDGCLQWMQDNGYPKPPRSACYFCPFHSDAEWLRLKSEEPTAFQAAVDWERVYQATVAQDEVTTSEPFLHESLVPLDQVQFDLSKRSSKFGNECEGICGI